MLIELRQELVLVLVHARRAAGLRAALVRPVVHRLEHLVLDAVGRLVPNDLRSLLLHGPGAVLERFAPEEKMIGRLRLHDGGDPAKRVFPVVAHGFHLVQHGLRPQRLQTLLLRLVVGSLLVFLGEALLRQRLPHVRLLALDVKKLKHFVGEQSGRGVEGAVPRLDLAHDTEAGASANLRDEVGVVDIRPIMARQTGSDVHAQGGVHDGIRIASDVSIFVRRVPFIAHVWRVGGREEKGCPSGGAERGSSRARASLSRGTREVVGNERGDR
mmetsp:Transcript_14014/g.59999  ORF Transcript_14014/g.59999 Transcript_14014/m.59999 type:complete len:271 (-) Transcript_14014:57-869(-)